MVQKTQELYKLNTQFGAEYDKNLHNIIENAIKNIDDNIDHFDIDALNMEVVTKPQYYKGTFDDNGVPIGAKQRELWERIVNAIDWVILVEGGFRGGKDVQALKAWADYLMLCPERLHIALGITLEHSLQTILLSGGFGIRNCLPHGRLIRKTINGAQRGVYEFTDAYGVQKEILFYGNAKKDDWEKFHGFNVGSFYVNEGRNQHINGLHETIARTSDAQHKLIIITQNPVGPANIFYREFEKPVLGTKSEIAIVKKIQNDYKDKFLEIQASMYTKMHEAIKTKMSEFLTSKGVPVEYDSIKRKFGGFDYLNDGEQIEFKTLEKKIRFDYEHGVRSLLVKDFVDWIPIVDKNGEPNKIAGMSMKKVINYIEGGKNPNGIKNFIDYYYAHFTFEDNPKMSEADRNDTLRRYPKGTAIYQQMILGIRKAVDHALYAEFGEQNIIKRDSPYWDITHFENSGLYTAVSGIDPGYNHQTGMLYAYIRYSDGFIFFVNERLKDKTEVQEPSDVLRIFLEMIRSLNDRRMPLTCIDPSAAATANHFLNHGVDVIAADNSRLMPEEYEKKFANKLQQKDIIGFELVRTYIKTGAIQVHPEYCPNLISQFESAEWVHDAEKDKDDRNKSNDDLTDPARYMINTFIGGTQYLKFDEENWNGYEKNDSGTIRSDEKEKTSERDLVTEFQQRINQFRGTQGGFFGERGSGQGFFGSGNRGGSPSETAREIARDKIKKSLFY